MWPFSVLFGIQTSFEHYTPANIVAAVSLAWTAVYFLLALRRAYAEPWPAAVIKGSTIVFSDLHRDSTCNVCRACARDCSHQASRVILRPAGSKRREPLLFSGERRGRLMLNAETGFGPLMFRYWSGHYTRSNSHLIVSNGVSNWFPLRREPRKSFVSLSSASDRFFAAEVAIAAVGVYKPLRCTL
jgi:hypothetical protein